MRKLTVKNFSVIKDAELEFGKITVLIGPQASGKSLLCKLAYFLGFELVGAAVESATSGRDWEEFEALVGVRFNEWFPRGAWEPQELQIKLELDRYLVELRDPLPETKNQIIRLSTSEEFKQIYSRLAQPSVTPITHPELKQDAAWGEFMHLQSTSTLVSKHFIPAGRAFFTSAERGFTSMQNPGLDPLTRRFATEVIWDSRKWMPGLLVSDRNVLDSIKAEMERIAGGAVTIRGNEPVFKTLKNGMLPLSVLSSGTQELLPLFNVLIRLAHTCEHLEGWIPAREDAEVSDRLVPIKQVVYLEEPETHVFPSTQYDLVKLFSWFASDPILSFDWVITTHSPYVLTAFNDLIKAGQIAAQRPDKAAEIEKIVPSRYWIKPGDFAAYAFDGKDGVLRPIMDDETKMINGDVLDDISEMISGEFGQLLEIQYGD